MLIPRFTIKSILAITAVVALVSLVQSRSLAGEKWAAGLMMSVFMLVSAFVLYAGFFAVAFVIGKFGGRRLHADPASPFAGAKPVVPLQGSPKSERSSDSTAGA